LKDRIQKVLAAQGLASRRHLEEWIRDGRISVNGKPATIGQKIDHRDRVKVDGREVELSHRAEPIRVLAYRKRVGEVVTRDDPEGRRTIFRKLPELEHGRWIAIGRLDVNTAGLLLLTNHGELARRLMHPSFALDREYAVRVLGDVDEALLERLRRGVKLEDGPAHFDWIQEGAGEGANRWFNVVVKAGRHRVVRRLWESQGLQVSRLIRVRFGPIALGRGTKTGSARELEAKELAGLLAAVGMEAPAPARPQSKKVKPVRPRLARARR
jgi:23S rRNA pseudouridine2605 synthase